MPMYTKEEAARIRAMAADSDRQLDNVPISDLSGKSPAAIIAGLQALVMTLEQGIIIAQRHHYEGHAEPFPGACKGVMEQSLRCVAIARASRILPEREG